ncbi:MAG: hypothetical protein H6Q31_2641 [Bacteroidetes bacterium]|nr:hypothetical protein [Bacteroidota bacterium]
MWPEQWWKQFDYTKPPFPLFLSWPAFNATSADFPDWPLFADVYGVEQCYKLAEGGGYYFNPKALLMWRSMVEENKSRDSVGNVTRHWGGSCAGFCLSALKYYNDVLSLQWTLGNYDSVYSVPIDDNSRYLVNKDYITFSGNYKPAPLLTGYQAVSTLHAMLVENYTNNQWVGMQDLVTGDAHAVVACSLSSAGSGFWELSIYDPNYPGTYMHLNYFELDGSWTAQELDWNALRIYLRPIGEYDRTPILPLVATATAAPGATSDSSRTIFNSPYADIRIRGSDGQTIGYAGSVPIDSMPGAQPRINFGASKIHPAGYYLPPGDYTAMIGKSLDTTTFFAIFLDASALASGVYIYRLQARPTDGVLAGTFVQSRKLLLLR